MSIAKAVAYGRVMKLVYQWGKKVENDRRPLNKTELEKLKADIHRALGVNSDLNK